jgi:asparagine N-glycosylation enzyme membrane subunit Stt3
MKKEIKKAIELGKSVVYNKDVRVWSTIILLAAILIISSQIRMNNIYALKDTTNGEYVMADPDATYFLRVAEAIHNNENSLPPLDSMRYVSMNASYSNELTPRAITWIYEVLNIYDETTVAYAAVIYPVVFFFLGTLVFFFLILYITKSKFIALISTAALSVVPSYLFRTMSGVADHEPIGMFSFYLTMLLFIFSMDFLKKICKNKSIKTILLAILFGEIMAFMIVAWSGIALLFFIIYPLSFLLIWLLDEDKKDLKYFLMFYYISFFVAILSAVLLYGYVLLNVLTIMVISSTSVLNGLLLIFLIIDYLLINYKGELPHPKS